MRGTLFLGIADNNRCASVVVGNSSGEIVSAGIGGSLNPHRWGIRRARSNLEKIREAVGFEVWSRLAGVCFTYKRGMQVTDEEMRPVVSGFLAQRYVQIEDFATTSTLGIHSPKERLLLVGGQIGSAILHAENGVRYQTRHEEYAWNPLQRVGSRLGSIVACGTEQDLTDYLRIKELEQSGECLFHLATFLDRLDEQGNPWALSVACDIAWDLYKLVTTLARWISRPDPVIGFYGPLLLGSDTIRRRVQYLIGLTYPQAEIIDAPLAPAKGAYLSSVLTRKTELEQEVLTTFYHSARSIMERGWLDFVTNN
jgi:hypothetical protein